LFELVLQSGQHRFFFTALPQQSTTFNIPGEKGPKFYWLLFSDQEMRLAQGRIFEHREKFRDRYRWPAGVEATMSEYDRRT